MDWVSYCKNNGYQAIGENHQNIKWIKSIIDNSKPNRDNLFVAEGLWLNKKVLASNTEVRAFILCPDFVITPECEAIAMQMTSRAKELYTVSAKTYQKLAERDKPDGILCLATLPSYDLDSVNTKGKSIIMVLDGVEIPGNIGTMLRVADAAAVSAVLVVNRKARLSHPKLIHSSMGAIFDVPVIECEGVSQAYNWLNKKGYAVYLTDTRAELNYFTTEYPNKVAFVMGSERYGINRDWYGFHHTQIMIPMLGKCDSLNVATAATILVFDAAMKLSKK